MNELSFLCLIKLPLMRSVNLLWNWFAEEWQLEESSQKDMVDVHHVMHSPFEETRKISDGCWYSWPIATWFRHTRPRIISLGSLWTRNDFPFLQCMRFPVWAWIELLQDLHFLSLVGNNTFPFGKGSTDTPRISTLCSTLYALCASVLRCFSSRFCKLTSLQCHIRWRNLAIEYYYLIIIFVMILLDCTAVSKLFPSKIAPAIKSIIDKVLKATWVEILDFTSSSVFLSSNNDSFLSCKTETFLLFSFSSWSHFLISKILAPLP